MAQKATKTRYRATAVRARDRGIGIDRQAARRGKSAARESVAIYERGEALKRRCEDLLRQAEVRVEKITLDAEGKPTGTEPLDVE